MRRRQAGMDWQTYGTSQLAIDAKQRLPRTIDPGTSNDVWKNCSGSVISWLMGVFSSDPRVDTGIEPPGASSALATPAAPEIAIAAAPATAAARVIMRLLMGIPFVCVVAANPKLDRTRTIGAERNTVNESWTNSLVVYRLSLAPTPSTQLVRLP